MLTGKYPPLQILKIANETWSFKMPSGKSMFRSSIYRIFTNTFYYGEFEYPKGSKNWYQGKHQAMITREQYDRIQILLGRKGSPRPKNHIFAFTGMIKCGECGASITAEEKIKRQKNGNIHQYTYYHCTKKKDPECSQRAIREKDLEKQIINALNNIQITLKFHQWAIGQLKIDGEKEVKDRNRILENQRKTYKSCVKKIDSLIEMRINNEITQEEFLDNKSTLLKEKNRLQELLNDSDKRIDMWIEKAESVFDFAHNAKRKFENGTLEEKRVILSALGSNLLLKDKKLSILMEKPFNLIEKMAQEVKTIDERLEPLKSLINTREIEKIYSQSPILLPGLDSNL